MKISAIQTTPWSLRVLSFNRGVFSACSKDLKPGKNYNGIPAEIPVRYSFFVAVHTYGKPGVNHGGFCPPFESKLNLIKNDTLMQFGLLTGDIGINGRDEKMGCN